MLRKNIIAKRHGAVRRTVRTRAKIHGTAERPRLSVFRSDKHISAQVINDVLGRTIVAASDVKIVASGKPLARAAAGGERVHAAGRDWDIIETSGHCRGHLCLYDAHAQVLIAGDQVLPTISPNVSVLPSRPDANPLKEFLDSLAALEQCAPETLVLPSHGLPFRGAHARIAQLQAHHAERLAELRAARKAAGVFGEA